MRTPLACSDRRRPWPPASGAGGRYPLAPPRRGATGCAGPPLRCGPSGAPRLHRRGCRFALAAHPAVELLEERVRRAQLTHKLDFGQSLEHLERTAINQICTSCGDLAMSSAQEWSKARHQMNGPNGHLDHLLDICHARGLPLQTAICVNQESSSWLPNFFLAGPSRSGFWDSARLESDAPRDANRPPIEAGFL